MTNERATASQHPVVTLRPVVDSDLPDFFRIQADPVATKMAAFTAKDTTDRDAFDVLWRKIRANPDTINRTIVVDGSVAGNIALFHDYGEADIGYGIDRSLWGKGIATQALAQFLALIEERPLFARAAADNAASIRMLERAGFTVTGEETNFAEGRGTEVLEYIYCLR